MFESFKKEKRPPGTSRCSRLVDSDVLEERSNYPDHETEIEKAHVVNNVMEVINAVEKQAMAKLTVDLEERCAVLCYLRAKGSTASSLLDDIIVQISICSYEFFSMGGTHSVILPLSLV